MITVAQVRRASRVAMAVLVAVVAGLLVSLVAVDVGPAIRARAERAGSTQIERPLHIGRLSIRILRGQFVVEDLLIEGLTPADRPFLRAKKIVVSMDWRTLVYREVMVRSVDMIDWQMLVEAFPNNRHTFPRFTRPREKPPGPKRFVTTVQVVRAVRGQFTFEDHVTPWSTVAPNLDVIVERGARYHGRAAFSGGTVRIQKYEPMWANMQAAFTIDDGRVRLHRIDMQTDGARSVVSGDVDLAHWPEQSYLVQSQIDFPRMRELFFARDRFTLFGEGEFTGIFHLFKGGRELRGTFESPLAGVNTFRFPDLRGSVVWLPDSLVVPHATARVHGGTAQFSYSMAPFGKPTPAIARFDATYRDVDLGSFTDFLQTEGIRLAGRATGHNLLEWPLGHFSEKRGDGRVSVQPPAGTRVLARVVPSELDSEEERLGPEVGPLAPHPNLGHLPIGGELVYSFGPAWIELKLSSVATPRTYVEFSGQTAYLERSRIPFHVTSADWQESDRVLAGIMTAFGARTGVVAVGGTGEFDGVMLGSFRKPRIEGSFVGQRMRAWNVEWGDGKADVVIENGYVTVKDGLLTAGRSEIHANGLFSLGYPRRDGGEELDARVTIFRRPLKDLRHAFELDDYPVHGLLSGEFHIYGGYETPSGFGRMNIEDGVAYGEPFTTASAGLRFEGNGVRLDALEIAKGGGRITGAAFVGWDGGYSFNADARRLPLESIAALAYPSAPLSGLLQFSASGNGTFDAPRYDVRARLGDLFIGEEGVGQLTGRFGVRGELMTIEMEAASPRLAVSGSGRIALTPEADAELTFRFSDTSLDPYVRMFEPRLSPFTTAIASGSIRLIGEMRNLEQMQVEASVEAVDLRLFDYKVRNDGPMTLALDRQLIRIDRMRLVGEGTELSVTGEVGLRDERIALKADGDANLGLLQGFFRDIRSSGAARLLAEIRGPLRAPVFSGSASVTNGRIRHFSLPHSLESINGRMSFDAEGIRMDDVVGRLGGGEVRLGGRLGLKGFAPGELSLTAIGKEMHLRYPEGVRSIVDADLTLRGDIYNPLLAGTVTVRSAIWTRQIDTSGAELFDFAGGGAPAVPAAPGVSFPLQFDLRVIAPSSLRIENKTARIVSSAELTLRGTYDRPLLFGRAEIERGEVLFEGNRYLVTRGSIDFANPTRIEPFFDIEAETRVRAPGQVYRVAFQAAGTADRFSFDLSSDPPLPTVDILALLFGEARDPRNAELRSLQSPESTEQELIRARATRLLASPISSEVGRVVEQTFGVDTVQITPSLGDTASQQSARLNPSARLTLGKRISDRVYLTFSRSLSTSTRDQIILLEYDQSDRIGWILSQNEDRTYALDFRVRHIF